MIYAMLIFSYLVGSLSFAIITSNIFKLEDPRTYGSNNAGATNVMRGGNKKAAIFTLLGDFLKGLVVVLIARLAFHHEVDSTIVGICGIFVVLGHIYPVFFKFRGGKGVATALGVFLGFNLWLFLLLLATWLVIFKLFKISSLAAIIATLLAPVYAYILVGNSAYFGATIIISAFVFYKHKANMIRLITKKEQPINKN